MNRLIAIFFVLLFNFAAILTAKEYDMSLSEVPNYSTSPCKRAFSLQDGRENFYFVQIKPDEIKKLKIGKVLFSGETKNGVFRNFDAFAWDNISADNESIREAIKAKDESYGEITEICVLGADKDTLKLKFSISRKIPEIFIDRSWFSKDKYIINILEESGSVETELQSDYAILIGVELVAEVVDSTPFWGDIPLLGQLFQSKSETRQIRWLLLKVSGRGQDKNGHSHE